MLTLPAPSIHLSKTLTPENLNVSSLLAELKRCSRSGNLRQGRKVHREVLDSGLSSNLFVVNTLINMYGRCGSVAEALGVFNCMPLRDVVSWNCLLQACVANEEDELALQLFEGMSGLQGSCEPDARTYVAALAACTALATRKDSAGRNWLAKAKSIHSRAAASQCCDVFVENRLIVLYSKCGLMSTAREVFDKMVLHDIASWNALLQGYVQNGESLLVLKLYDRMEEEASCFPDARTYMTVLSACATLATRKDGPKDRKWLEKAKGVHSRALRNRCCDVYVETKLIEMYSTCGCIEEARDVFDKTTHRSVVPWNCIIQGYVDSGDSEQALELFDQMEACCTPNERTFVAALTACASLGGKKDGKVWKWLTIGRSLHSRAVMTRCCNRFVNNILITMYGSCGSLEDAKSVFDNMAERDIVSCTALMKAYVEDDRSELALELFETLEKDGSLVPDAKFYVAALTACSALAERDNQGHEKRRRWLAQGKQIHARAVEHTCCDIYVENSLIDLYSKCGNMKDARDVFDNMLRRDAVSWTVLLQGYVQNNESELVLELFENMEEDDRDCRVYVAALKACNNLCSKNRDQESEAAGSWLERGSAIFLRAQVNNRCGIYVWNCWIRGCVENGENELALEQVREMQSAGVVRDSGTYIASLMACGSLMKLENGRTFHAEVLSHGWEEDVLLATCLVDFYGKCGAMRAAEQMFDTLTPKDVGLWNALLGGYSHHGDSSQCFHLFHEMETHGLHPDERTFTHILAVCSHAGLTSKGKAYFYGMSSKYGVSPTVVHCACMVDLLARGNHLDEAIKVITDMSCEGDGVVWTALLGGCRTWKNDKIGQVAYEHLLKLNGREAATYNLMANIYSE